MGVPTMSRVWVIAVSLFILLASLGLRSYVIQPEEGIVYLGSDEAVSGSGKEYLQVYTGGVENYSALVIHFMAYPDEAIGDSQILRAGELTSAGVRHASGDDALRTFALTGMCGDQDPGPIAATTASGYYSTKRVFSLQTAPWVMENTRTAASAAVGTLYCSNLQAGPVCIGRVSWYGDNDSAGVEGACTAVFANAYPVDMSASGGMAGLRIFFASQFTPSYVYQDIVGRMDAWGLLR